MKAETRYEFTFSTISQNEWTKAYFDHWQKDGWELFSIAPLGGSEFHTCYWRKQESNEG